MQSSCQLSAKDKARVEEEKLLAEKEEEEEEDPHGENCQECKQKVQGALTDTLPPTVAEGENTQLCMTMRTEKHCVFISIQHAVLINESKA